MVEQAEKISFTVNKSQIGQRLDIYLAQSEAALSRSQVKYAIEEGDVRSEGQIFILDIWILDTGLRRYDVF